MEKRLLSICIPTYNRNYELKRLYDNFLSVVIDKFRDDVEIIVCDNSVPDKANLNEKLFKGTGVIYYANEKNLGFAGNVLKCYRLASGKFIWLLPDNDDILTDEFVKMFKCLSVNRDSIGAIFLQYRWQGLFLEQTILYPQITCINDFFKKDIVPFVLLSNAIVRRNMDNYDIIEEKFSNNDFVQIALHSMAIKDGEQLYFYPNPVIYYHVEYVGRFNPVKVFDSMHAVLEYLSLYYTVDIAKRDYFEYLEKQKAILSHDLGIIKVYEVEEIREELMAMIGKYKGIKTYIFHFLLNLPKKLRRILYGLIVLLLSSPRTLYLYPKYLKLKKRIRQTKSIV